MFSPCANAGVNINVPPVAVTSIATDNIAAAGEDDRQENSFVYVRVHRVQV